MSSTCYRAMEKCTEIFHKNLKATKVQKQFIISFIIGLIFLLVALVANNHDRSYMTVVFVCVGISAEIVAYYFSKKIVTDHEKNDEKIKEFYNFLKLINIDSLEKIDYMQSELVRKSEESQNEVKSFFRGIGKIVMNVFWIPLGVLLTFYFKNNVDIYKDFNNVVGIGIALLMLTILVIGFFIMLGPQPHSYFDFGSTERNRLYRTLDDVKYRYYMSGNSCSCGGN